MKRVKPLLMCFSLAMLICGTMSIHAQEKKMEKNLPLNPGNPVIAMETTMGTIKIVLTPPSVPDTVENFLQYIANDFYNDTIFHRVIPGFMIQGGGFTKDMKPKSGIRKPIKNEADIAKPNKRGTIAMARTNDPHSATAQFFINLKDNDFLDYKNKSMQGWGYTVFGRVIQGMEVVDKIAAVKTGNHMRHQNVPLEPVVITKVSIVPYQKNLNVPSEQK